MGRAVLGRRARGSFGAGARFARAATVLFAFAALTLAASLPAAAAADLADATLAIAGARLTVSPESQTVPFDTPTEVLTQLQGFDAAHGTLPPGLLVMGDLSGPQISGVLTLQTAPGQPFQIPRLQIQGQYQLDNIRLMQAGSLIGYAQPRSAALTVTQVLVTKVTSRALTTDEIRSYGIVVNASNIQAYVFTFAFAVAGGPPVNYNVPVVYNTAGDSPVVQPLFQQVGQDNGGAHSGVRFTPPRMAPFTLGLQPAAASAGAYGGCLNEEGDCSTNPQLPLPGVILFPTDISLLHQFFSVILMVQNGAPQGDPLILRDLSARLTLPPGLRQASTQPPTPLGVPIPIRVPGPDGILGTADDITFLVAQASGQAEVLTEGLEEGTHIVQFDIEGLVDGLPGGKLQTIVGHAQGAVVVRDPTLNVTVTHPAVVRADEQYQLLLTVSNTGSSPANQLTIRLPPEKLAGVEVVGDSQKTIDLLPGDSQLVEFTLKSHLTGKVVADAVRNSSQITPTFDLSVGVGENNIPLSPNAIILPDAAGSLPPDLLRADLNLIGLGYSLATAPPALLTTSSLPQVSLGAIDARVFELAQAGVQVTMGEQLFDSAAVLAALWTGAQDRDSAWDQLRRITEKGGTAGARLAAVFAAEAAATSPRAAFDRFAATTAYLRRAQGGLQGALAAGAGARLQVTSRATGQRLAGGGLDLARLRELPFADLHLLAAPDGTQLAQMALMAVPEPTGYQVRLQIPVAGGGGGGGTADLHLLVPAADGSLRLVRWPGVALSAAGSATVAYAPGDASFTLQVDAQGTGTATQQLAGSVETLAPRPFTVVAAMQNAVADPSGHVVDVLFSGDVDLTSVAPADPSHFLVSGKVSNGGLTRVDLDIVAQAQQTAPGNPAALRNSRLLRVVFNNPLSPYAQPVNLTVSRVTSAAAETLAALQLPIRITVTAPGELVSGVVLGANGLPVPFAQVTLHENDVCLSCGEGPCSSHKTAIVQADAGGHYLFDYVRHTDECGDSFALSAVDPTSNETGTATGRVRLIGQTARLDVEMLGRGTIRGRIAYDDGTLPVNPQIIAYSPVFREAAYGTVDAYGNYSIANVAVGTITLSGSDRQGKYVITTLAVPSSGSVVAFDLVILRLPSKPVQTGQLRGQVVRPDGTTPVALAYVALYVSGNLIDVRRSAPDGSFDFGVVPAGEAEVDTYENETGQSGAQVFFQINPDQVSQIKLTMVDRRGAVEGHVYRQTGSTIVPIAGAVVWVDGTPFRTFTDAQGFYHLDGVFTGSWNIDAADLVSKTTVAQLVTIESEGYTATSDLYFKNVLPSGIAGQVLDFAGAPVGGAIVHLAAGDQNWWDEAQTDLTGTFTLPGLSPGSYTVHAIKGTAGGFAGAVIRFDGDTPYVTIRFKQGTIRGTVQAKDGTGHVTGVKSAITYRTTVVREGLVGLALTPTTIETADDGTFEVDNVLAGSYQLSAYNAFYGSLTVSGTIVNQGEVQTQTLVFQKDGPGTIKGVVLNQDGVTPAAGAAVHLAHPAFSAYDLTADSAGGFEFDLVPPTPWGFPVQVTFQDGVIFRRAQVYVSFTQPGQTLTVQIVLPRQGSVAGSVEDADGHPVPGSVVTLTESQYPYQQLAVNADANAAYQFTNVFAGTASISARAPTLGGLGGKIAVQIDNEGQSLTGQVIRLQPTGKIAGRVLSPVDGSAVANAEVKLYGGWNLFDTINTDAAGKFEFDLLPLATYDVYAFDPRTGRAGHTAGLAVAANDQLVTGDVTLEARGGVLGHLYDPDVVPPLGLPAATISLLSRGITSFVTYSSTDLQGAFQFQGIPQGPFVLSAREPQGRRNASGQGTIVNEGDQVTVDLSLQREGTVSGSALDPVGATTGKFQNVNVTMVQDGQIIGGVLASDYQFGGIIVGRPFEIDAQEVGGSHRGSATGTLSDANPLALDVQMVPIGAVRVVVEDSFGNPVPGASVTLYTVGFYGYHVLHATTGASADALFQAIGAGNIGAVAANPLTNLSGSASGTLDRDGQIAQLTVKLEDTGTVQGTLLLADGVTPAAGAVAALRAGGGRLLTIQTDGAGAFVFHSVPLGGFDLQFQQNLGPGTLELTGAVGSNGQVVDLGTLTLDATDLQVLSITPPAGAVGVSLTPTLTIVFNKPIDAGRNLMLSGDVNLIRSDGRPITNYASLSADGKTVSLVTVPLDNATTYLIRVNAGTFSTSGRQLLQSVQTSFTTVDHLAPAVIHVDPAAGAVKVPVGAQLHLIFNRPVDPASLSGGHLQLLDLTANLQLATTFTPSATGRELLITPVAALAQAHRIQLTVQGLVDLVGNVQAQSFVSGFTTIDLTAPSIGSVLPAAGTVYTAGDPVAISATVADDDLAGVTFSFGDRSVTLAGPPFSWTAPAPPVAAASDLPITIVAVDASGNSATVTQLVHVLPKAAAGPPAVALACPTTGALLAPGTSLNLAATATEASGIYKIEVFVGSGGSAATPLATLFDPPYTYAFAAPSGAADGQVLHVRLRATSFGDTTAEAAADFTVVAGNVLTADTVIAATDTHRDGASLIVAGGTTTIDGPHAFRDLVVLDGATVTHSPTTDAQENHLAVTLSRGLYVACGGAVDVTDRGYQGAIFNDGSHAWGYGNTQAEGAGPTGAGGSHGGRGGRYDATSPVYGSVFDPQDPGAGGGYLAGSPGATDHGGGVVRITAAGAALIDGAVRASGSQAAIGGAGGGAGGSIRLNAAALGGAGVVQALGGLPTSWPDPTRTGGGSGGRIALYAASIDPGLLSRTLAAGGAGAAATATDPALRGAAGTIFVKLDANPAGDLIIDNAGIVSSQLTELPSVGSGTVTSVAATAFTDSLADFHHDLTGVDVVFNGNLGTLYPIAGHAHHGQTLNLSVAAPPLGAAIQPGAAYGGLYNLRNLIVRGGANAIAVDAVSSVNPPQVASGASWTPAYAPTLQITSPAAGATVTAGAPLTVSASVADQLGVSRMALAIGGGGNVTLTAPPYTWATNAPAETASTDVPVTATVFSGGTYQTASVTIHVDPAVDPQAPAVTLSCWHDGDLVAAGVAIPISFTIADALLVSSYSLVVDGVTVQTVNPNQATVAGSLTWTPPAGTAPGTSFTVSISAVNPAGHVGAAALHLVAAAASALTGNLTLGSAYTGQSLVLAGGTFTVPAPLSLGSLALLQGARVVGVAGAPLSLTVAGALTVECGAAIDMTALGYLGATASNSPGAAPPGVRASQVDAGGSHGGSGVGSRFYPGPAGDVYDSVYLPQLAGGGASIYSTGYGARGGNGGGAVSLTAGTLRLYGQILARGEAGHAPSLARAGGAGGAVVVHAGTLAGTGSIDVSGGAGDIYSGGAGGGGRVALYATAFQGFDPAAQAVSQGGARGESGQTVGYGGPGTIYFRDASATYGRLLLDSGRDGAGHDQVGPATPLPALGAGAVSAWTAAGGDAWLTAAAAFGQQWLGVWVAVSDGAGGALGEFQVSQVDAQGRALLSGAGAVHGAASYQGEYRFDRIDLRSSAGLAGSDAIKSGDVQVYGAAARLPAAQLVATTMTLNAGAMVGPAAGGVLQLSVSGQLTIQSGARIDVSGLGYQGATASNSAGTAPPAVNPSQVDAGGSHGGPGVGSRYHAGPAGDAYDSVYLPQLGGGGASIYSTGYGARGGNGGGTVSLTAGSLQLDGQILAQGEAWNGPSLARAGGAGGAVTVHAGTLAGAGTIDVSGGAGDASSGGAGGGGRAALYVTAAQGFAAATQVNARGGAMTGGASPFAYAGPGTVFDRQPGQTYGSLRVDGGTAAGAPAATTPLPAIGQGTIGSVAPAAGDPASVWITAQAGTPLFSLGAIGMWVRLNGADYPVTGQSADRTQLLLQGAAGAAAVGQHFFGVYKFDAVTVTGGAAVQLGDELISGSTQVDPGSTLTSPDLLPPVISNLQPAAGTVFTAGQPVAISFAVADDDLAAVTVTFGEQSVTLTAAPFAWTVPAPAVAAASDVPIQIVATDRSSNSATVTRLVHVLPASAGGPPVVALTCPTAGAMLAPGTSLNLTATAAEASGIAKVELFLGSATTPLARLLSPPYTFSFSPPAGSTDGQVLHLRVRATSFGATTAEAATDLTVVTGNVLTASTAIAAANSQYDGASLIVAGGTVTIDGPHSFRDLVVLDGATVNHSPTSAAQENHLLVNLMRNLYVACGGAVDVSGRGYLGGAAAGAHAYGYGNTTVEGAAPAGAGGSYGGRGGRYDGSSPVYGSFWNPQDPGAGGGWAGGTPSGANGGGVIDVNAGGAAVVDGRVRANGGPSPTGGGSGGGTGGGAGGSVILNAAALSGAGSVQALGGPPTATPSPAQTGGGSGGRIALYGHTIDAGLLARSSAAGAAGTSSDASTWGAAGTIFAKLDTSQYGDLIVDNAGIASSQLTELLAVGSGTATAVGVTSFTDSLADFHHDLSGIGVLFNGNAGALFPITANAHHGQTLTLQVAAPPLSGAVQPGAAYSGQYNFGNVIVRGGAQVVSADGVASTNPPQVASGSTWTPAYSGTVQITSPAAGASVTAGTPMTVSAGVTDLLGVSRVVFSIGSQGSQGSQSFSVATPPYTWSTLAPGGSVAADFLVTATAYGSGGNHFSTSITIHSTPGVDPQAPVISLTCVHDGDLAVAGATVPIAFTIVDATQVSSYSVMVNGTVVQTATPNQPAVSASVNWTVPAGAAPGNSYSVQITAVNPGGHVGSVTMNLVVAGSGVLAGSISLGSSYSGQSLVLGAGTFTVPGALTLGSLRLLSGALVQGAAGQALSLTVTGTLAVQCGAAIDVTTQGYAGGTGSNASGTAPPGVAASGVDAGGSHGGMGFIYGSFSGQPGAVFDSVYVPQLAGAGGSLQYGASGRHGGNGGGVVSLTVGALQLNGQIRATGESRPQPGVTDSSGAGGSVLVVAAGTVSGSGLVDASGGQYDSWNYYGTPGAGGRVALYAGSFQGFDPTAQVKAQGGALLRPNPAPPYMYAGAGTIFWKDAAATYGRLLIDSGKDSGGHDQVGPSTPLPALGGGAVSAWAAAGGSAWLAAAVPFQQPWLGAWVALQDGGGNALGEFQVSQIDGQGRLLLAGAALVAGAAAYQGEYRFDRVDLQSGAGLSASDPIKTGDIEIAGAEASLLAPQLSAGSMTVKSGAVVTPASGGTLRLAVTGLLTVQAGGRIDVTGTGYAGGTGSNVPGTAPPGVAASGLDAGGSHGGMGFIYGGFSGQPGAVFDSVYVPQLAGGGGSLQYGAVGRHGGNGGGVVDLTAGSLQLDGEIRARGEARPQPGVTDSSGAGGSVILRIAGTISGAGLVDASGGQYDSWNYYGTPGAGGRVALYAGSFQGFDPTAQVKAQGGALLRPNPAPLYYYAGAGTIFWKDAAATYGRLLIDSGKDSGGHDQVGPSTPLPALGGGAVSAWAAAAGGGAWLAAAVPFQQPWLGAWVALQDAGGNALGEFQVSQIDGQGRLLLAGAGSVAGAAAYQGEYRFDRIDLQSGAGLSASDPIKTGDIEIAGAEASLLAPQLSAGSMTVKSGAVVTPASGGTLRLAVTGLLTVQAGGRIDVTGTGYAGGTGSNVPGTAPPGVAASGLDAGGSHGGMGFIYGGFSGQPGAVFDSVYVPQLAGGGGSLQYGAVGRHGGNGGGVVDLTAGSLQLDGEIRAWGEARPQPGVTDSSGAGGSVILRIAGSISGTGLIDASGGQYDSWNYYGTPGAGGRVALYAGSFQGFDPTAQVKAQGGALLRPNPAPPYMYAGAGTIFWKDAAATYGRLLIDSGKDTGGHDQVGPSTPLPALGGGAVSAWAAAGGSAWLAAAVPFQQPWLGAWVALQDAGGNALGEFQVSQIDGQGRLLLAGAGSVAGAAAYQGEYRFDRIDLQSGAGLSASDPIKTGDIEIAGAEASLQAPQFSAGSMTVKSGAVVGPGSGSTLRLTVTGQLTVEAGGRIDATGAGYAGGMGSNVPGTAPPGVAASGIDAGGSHGGMSFIYGGFSGQPGAVFDSVYVPQLSGGGGSLQYGAVGRHGGNGGGVVDLTAGSLQLDGEIRARGEARPQPGVTDSSGAGGSVILRVAGTISGAGLVDAAGGLYNAWNYWGSSGAGGRVAVYAGNFQGFSPTAQLMARGGQLTDSGVVRYAGPGTVYFKGAGATYGRLLIDSGLGSSSSQALPITPLPGIGVGTVGTATADAAVPANLWITASGGGAFQLGSAGMWVRVNGTDYPVATQSADLKSLELAGAAGGVHVADSFRGVYKFDEVDVRGGAKLQFNDTNVVGTFVVDPNSAVIQNAP